MVVPYMPHHNKGTRFTQLMMISHCLTCFHVRLICYGAIVILIYTATLMVLRLNHSMFYRHFVACMVLFNIDWYLLHTLYQNSYLKTTSCLTQGKKSACDGRNVHKSNINEFSYSLKTIMHNCPDKQFCLF